MQEVENYSIGVCFFLNLMRKTKSFTIMVRTKIKILIFGKKNQPIVQVTLDIIFYQFKKFIYMKNNQIFFVAYFSYLKLFINLSLRDSFCL